MKTVACTCTTRAGAALLCVRCVRDGRQTPLAGSARGLTQQSARVTQHHEHLWPLAIRSKQRHRSSPACTASCHAGGRRHCAGFGACMASHLQGTLLIIVAGAQEATDAHGKHEDTSVGSPRHGYVDAIPAGRGESAMMSAPDTLRLLVTCFCADPPHRLQGATGASCMCRTLICQPSLLASTAMCLVMPHSRKTQRRRTSSSPSLPAGQSSS